MWNDQDYFENTSRTATEVIPTYAQVGIRQTVALALGLYNPRTAQGYVTQKEMTNWANLSINEGLMVCAGDGALASVPQSPGFNPYVSLIGDVSDDIPPDPRVRLREVFVPTIVLRGECDYIDWGVVQQYWEVLPNIQVYYVEKAGSRLHLSQPDIVRKLLLAFFNDEPMPLEPLSEQAISLALPIIDEVR
jgi:proline iminopeptidase